MEQSFGPDLRLGKQVTYVQLSWNEEVPEVARRILS